MGAQCSNPLFMRGHILTRDREIFATTENFEHIKKHYIPRNVHEEALSQCYEQCNLLRFKVEVLVNMLVIEEKKMDYLIKRTDVLKSKLLSQGISEDGLAEVMRSIHSPLDSKSPKDDVDQISTVYKVNDNIIYQSIDMKGAIDRISEEFNAYALEILRSFADEEGKIVTYLTRDEFMRQLFAATSTVSKADIQAISLRFYDGSMVSVPEFIDYFMLTSEVRSVKAAASAVRVSLELLQLDHSENLEFKAPQANDIISQESLKVLTLFSGWILQNCSPNVRYFI